ncbi:hypothetical protein ACFVUS_20810 [Nocardia sp. NPDC058058]|uniref:hypothetical protein n=1 Tax=Nocardia sp. NPDC058058 TaxID=3346317 RepID=UPI0036D92063
MVVRKELFKVVDGYIETRLSERSADTMGASWLTTDVQSARSLVELVDLIARIDSGTETGKHSHDGNVWTVEIDASGISMEHLYSSRLGVYTMSLEDALSILEQYWRAAVDAGRAAPIKREMKRFSNVNRRSPKIPWADEFEY